MTTNRQARRAERAAQKALRRLTRAENERLRQQGARFYQHESVQFNGVRWMPIPGIDTHEVNNRGHIRMKHS